jgi:DNA polymerase III alpha subunit (gram-positive type)
MVIRAYSRLNGERIHFKVERLKGLKADLHLHTAEDPVDRVGYTAQDLIAKAADEDFEIISITNHQQMTFSQDLFFYAKKEVSSSSLVWK